MNGTEWTEPGQGATIRQLCAAVDDQFGVLHTSADDRLHVEPNSAVTNLRLTGSPLTAEDLQRISECEVAK